MPCCCCCRCCCCCCCSKRQHEQSSDWEDKSLTSQSSNNSGLSHSTSQEDADICDTCGGKKSQSNASATIKIKHSSSVEYCIVCGGKKKSDQENSCDSPLGDKKATVKISCEAFQKPSKHSQANIEDSCDSLLSKKGGNMEFSCELQEKKPNVNDTCSLLQKIAKINKCSHSDDSCDSHHANRCNKHHTDDSSDTLQSDGHRRKVSHERCNVCGRKKHSPSPSPSPYKKDKTRGVHRDKCSSPKQKPANKCNEPENRTKSTGDCCEIIKASFAPKHKESRSDKPQTPLSGNCSTSHAEATCPRKCGNHHGQYNSTCDSNHKKSDRHKDNNSHERKKGPSKHGICQCDNDNPKGLVYISVKPCSKTKNNASGSNSDKKLTCDGVQPKKSHHDTKPHKKTRGRKSNGELHGKDRNFCSITVSHLKLAQEFKGTRDKQDTKSDKQNNAPETVNILKR